MSKLANPWKCDASNCGILRANDTNHWMLIFLSEAPYVAASIKSICITPWNEARAEAPGTKHACGVDCGLKVIAQLIVENFFPNDSTSAGKEAADGQA